MKPYIVCYYYPKYSLKGTYGHHRNPYYVSQHDKICDAREHAYQLAKDSGEAISNIMIGEDLYRAMEWEIRVMPLGKWKKYSNFVWDEEHVKYKGAFWDDTLCKVKKEVI